MSFWRKRSDGEHTDPTANAEHAGAAPDAPRPEATPYGARRGTPGQRPPGVPWPAGLPGRSGVLNEAPVAAYIARQRWAGAKGTALADVRIEALVSLDALPAFADARPAAVAVVSASLGGAPVRYQLPLVSRTTPAAGEVGGDVICYAGQTPRAITDGVADAAYRAALLAAFVGEEETAEATDHAPSSTLRWRAARVRPGGVLAGTDAWLDDPAAVAAAAAAARVGSAEQSNTSILYGERAILKLFRRIEHGRHPDVEIGAFLAARGFAHVPALLGTLGLVDAEGESVAGMLQSLVPGAEDAWAHAVRAAGDAVAGRVDLGAYAPEAARLGAVTRALHDVLASDASVPEFAPEPAQMADVRRWAQGAHAAYDAMRVAAEAAGTALPDAVMDRAAALERVDALAADAADDAGAAVRHHGDYHLGQVLRAADGGLFVVDFEGEPAKPLAERRRKHSPLRDVAGMLRSFAYAAAFAARESGAPSGEHAAVWERSARDAFLGAYFDGGSFAERAAYLPRSRAHADALIGLFETEKLYYELRYELSNRPDWVGIPLQGLERGRG